MELITVAIEARVLARKLIHKDGTRTSLILTSKEDKAVQIILNKYLEEAQQELQHFLNLTRKHDDKTSIRTNRQRAITTDN